jgi:catechol 2,3-dioxygenase-like lactoylglutathione lyase family enzyme
MIQGIEHVAIASPDPKRLALWYVETLGFAINYDSGRTVFVRAPNGSMIEIITAEGDRAAQTMKLPGIRHIALVADDFDADYARLRASGATLLGDAQEAKGVKTAFFTDPDGNYLHFIQRQTPLP